MKHRTELQCRREQGQALVESLVVMGGLLALYGAIAWLGRYQDITLQAVHASRYAAFSVARDAALRPTASIRRHFFSGLSHQWGRPDGTRVFDQPQTRLALTVSKGRLGPMALPGGAAASASALRSGLKLDGPRLYDASVAVHFAGSTVPDPVSGGKGVAGLRPRLGAYPSIVRHTAILADAGHSGGDIQAQRRVAESGPGWGDIAGRSQALGRRIAARMVPIDHAWGRDSPELDWLVPWAGVVPGFHLSQRRGGQ